MFGSGRAILVSARQLPPRPAGSEASDWISNTSAFTRILDDDVGVYDEDAAGNPIYNFSYVDQIYDGLLENGVRPFVELSFMPKKLAAQQAVQSFWYTPIVSPPKDWDRWGDLISHFAQHLVDRYGIDEVSQWYFEVWNEPNLDFWAGDPKEATYYHLYDVTAKALKSVNSRLRVGGPATAQAAWVDRFIRHCADNHSPARFCFHVTSTQTIRRRRLRHERIHPADANGLPRRSQSSRSSGGVLRCRICQSSGVNTTPAIKTSRMSPIRSLWGRGLPDTIRQCDGLVDMLSYWTFSDVFEEQGVVKKPFYGGYGLIAEDDLPKPSFNAFKLLHRLGDRRIADASDSALVTRRADGRLVMAIWNESLPERGRRIQNRDPSA